MITITKKPYLCTFSKNNIDFEIETNRYFKGPFIYPGIEIEFTALPLIGEHFAVQWTNPETTENEEIRLIAKDGTDPDEYSELYEIPDNTWTGTTQEYRDLVLLKLQSTPLFNGVYRIEATGTQKITMTATQALSELIPTWVTNQASTNIATVIKNGFALPDPRDGYQLRALVYFEKEYNSGEFEIVSNIPMVVDNDSRSIIDISDVLNAEIENAWEEYPVPFNQDLAYVAPNLKRYYVKFIEFWDGESVPVSTTTDIMLVHWGGVSTDDHLMADPVTLLSNGNGFLTWWPSGKRLATDQDDWLGWMNQQSTTTFQIYVRLITDAGESNILLHDITLQKFETIIFNTGYEANDLESLVPGETIARWGFYVRKSPGAIISPVYMYYKDAACIRKVIQYFNSFGIPETFHTYSDWSENMNVTTELASRASAFGLNSLFPQSFVFHSKHQNSMQAVTGALSNEEARRLQSMINSLIAFVKEDERWIPCVLNTGKTPIMKLDAFTQRIELEILKANENDRASFFPLQPDLQIVEEAGIVRILVIDNGLNITSYGDIECYNEAGTLEDTFTWDALNEYYEPAAPITGMGTYMFQGTIGTSSESFDIIKYHTYSAFMVECAVYDTGLVQFELGVTTGGGAVVVDWGDGDTTLNAFGALTAIQHTYTKTGKKTVRIWSNTFENIKKFYLYNDFGNVETGLMTNLEIFEYRNGPAGNFYLSHLSKLTNILFDNTQINQLEVGFQKDLIYLTLTDTLITSDNLDALLYELWTYRKLYAGTPTIYLVNLGYTESAYFTSIADGTGDFAGEGLVANYGWTINIV